VGLDNKNAQTKRNMVKSEDVEVESSELAQDSSTERGQAQLKQSVEEAGKAHGDRTEGDVADDGRDGRDAFVGEGASARAGGRALLPADEAKAAGATGAVMRESPSDDSQGVAKEQARADRFAGGDDAPGADEELKGQRGAAMADRDGRAAKAEHDKDRTVSGDDEDLAERDLKVKKEAIDGDEVLSGEEDAPEDRDARAPKEAVPGDEELVGDAPEPEKDNRQKMNALAEAAKRILLQAQALVSGPARADNALEVVRGQAELEGQNAAPVAPALSDPEVAPQVAVLTETPIEAVAEVPAPVALTAAELAESEFQARIRALKTNMHVTDGILTELQHKPPRT
jgi:hypothetical protein